MMFIFKTIYNMQLRRCMCSNTRIQIMQDAFGLNENESTSFLHYISRKDPDSFLLAIKTCRKLGFTNEDILLFPRLLNMKPMILEQRFLVLEEGGFKQISPNIILQYRRLLRENISELKQRNYVPSDINVAESFSKYFDPKPENGVIDFNQFSDNERLMVTHTNLLKLYLGWRLQATEEQIEKLFRIHFIMKNKSVRLLCENIRLALEAGLSLRRIRTAGYLLYGYPSYTKEVLRDYSNIAGGDLKKAIMGCPKLLMNSPEKYARIYGLLKKHEISDETIRNHLNVFQYAPQTIQYRLEEIDKLPELRILKHNHKFLSLVVHHQRAKSRMCYLQELQMKCLPLKLLALKPHIDQELLSGIDMNDSKEVVTFFKTLLKCKRRQFEKLLKKHPHYCAVPLLKIEETYNYLKGIKFTDDAISKVAVILLYPREYVKETLASIRKDPIFQKSQSQCERLNFLLYTLEKKFNFSGIGIWPQTKKDEMKKS